MMLHLLHSNVMKNSSHIDVFTMRLNDNSKVAFFVGPPYINMLKNYPIKQFLTAVIPRFLYCSNPAAILNFYN